MPKAFIASIGGLILGLLLYSCGTSKGGKKSISQLPLTSRIDSVSYAFGLINANGFQRILSESVIGDSLSRKQILKAFEHTLLSEKPYISTVHADSLVHNFFSDLKAQRIRQAVEFADSVLARNREQSGVQVTESGLQYRQLRQGTGRRPTAQDTVVVHYVGRTHDGNEFDSSYKRGESAEFPLNAVIKGWTEGVALMQEGAKYEFCIPYHLAYGERGAGKDIPPYSTLFFEIELLAVKPYVDTNTLKGGQTEPSEIKVINKKKSK